MDTTAIAVIALGIEALIILMWVRTLLRRLERVERVIAPRPLAVGYPGQVIPQVTFQGTGDLGMTIGTDAMRFNGEPFPFATMGPMSLEFSDDEVTVLVARIPVSMVDTLGPLVAREDDPEPYYAREGTRVVAREDVEDGFADPADPNVVVR